MIPQDESDAGLLAYERVLAFDALRRKRLPAMYVMFTLFFAAMTVVAFEEAMPTAAVACFGAVLFSAIFSFWNWRRLSLEDTKNRALLAELQAKYGDELPWLQVERQLAELERIKLELARGELAPPPEES